jgi:hypothetical protein
MAILVTNEPDFKEFLKSYDVDTDDRLILEYDLNKITNGSVDYKFWLVLYNGDVFRFDGYRIPYLGLQKNVNSIDRQLRCLYRIGRRVYYRNPIAPKIDLNKLKIEKKEVDTSKLLDVEIKEKDNELLIIVKELLRGYTNNAFKKLFTSVSEYNNIRREIAGDNNNGQITWNRFRYLLDMLNFDYELKIMERPKLELPGKKVKVYIEKKTK